MENTTPTFKAGTLAYVDSFSSLIPCKVLRVWRDGDAPNLRLDLYMTGRNRKGNRVSSDFASHVIPRVRVYRSRQHSGQWRILPYAWELTA